jgi:hypothetical protein
MTKRARQANHLERLNISLRQCSSRLVRDILSFSKTLANPIGTITVYIRRDQLAQVAAFPV